MRKYLLAGLLATGIESAIAHPGGPSAAQHGFEHLILGLAFALPGLVSLRKWRRTDRTPRRIRVRNRRP